MLITTLVNAVSTQNVAGYITNSTKTSFTATTSAYSIAASLLAAPSLDGLNVQRTVRVWFQHSPFSLAAADFAAKCCSPMCLEVTPRQAGGNTAIAQTVAMPAMGTFLYCWVEMPSITTAGGTITVDLVELN